MLESLRNIASDWLALRSIQQHRSRVGRHDAPKYTAYLEKARAAYSGRLPPAGELARSLDAFGHDGVTSFVTATTADVAKSVAGRLAVLERSGQAWEPESEFGNQNYRGDVYRDFPEIEQLFAGPLGVFLENHFECHFKVFFGTLYRSTSAAGRRLGSQLWHSDSGPGTCVNVMFYPFETDAQSGTLEVLPWPFSLALYRKERAALRRRLGAGAVGKNRDALCAWYGEQIEAHYAAEVRHPFGSAGMVVPFLNNTLHRGGYPAPGRTRVAMVFHCYPSHVPASFERYRQRGIAKKAPFPADPAEEF